MLQWMVGLSEWSAGWLLFHLLQLFRCIEADRLLCSYFVMFWFYSFRCSKLYWYKVLAGKYKKIFLSRIALQSIPLPWGRLIGQLNGVRLNFVFWFRIFEVICYLRIVILQLLLSLRMAVCWFARCILSADWSVQMLWLDLKGSGSLFWRRESSRCAILVSRCFLSGLVRTLRCCLSMGRRTPSKRRLDYEPAIKLSTH